VYESYYNYQNSYYDNYCNPYYYQCNCVRSCPFFGSCTTTCQTCTGYNGCYRYYTSTYGSPTWMQLDDISVTYNPPALTNGTTYQYWLTEVDNFGSESAPQSTWATATAR